jgi:hypothetical protein
MNNNCIALLLYHYAQFINIFLNYFTTCPSVLELLVLEFLSETLETLPEMKYVTKSVGLFSISLVCFLDIWLIRGHSILLHALVL